VLKKLFPGDSGLFFDLQASFYDAFGSLAQCDFRWEGQWLRDKQFIEYLSLQLLHELYKVRAMPRSGPVYHLVENEPEGPYIAFGSVGFSFEDLR
jgi:hypothetical protein